jgi:hypothetical protein
MTLSVCCLIVVNFLRVDAASLRPIINNAYAALSVAWKNFLGANSGCDVYTRPSVGISQCKREKRWFLKIGDECLFTFFGQTFPAHSAETAEYKAEKYCLRHESIEGGSNDLSLSQNPTVTVLYNNADYRRHGIFVECPDIGLYSDTSREFASLISGNEGLKAQTHRRNIEILVSKYFTNLLNPESDNYIKDWANENCRSKTEGVLPDKVRWLRKFLFQEIRGKLRLFVPFQGL